MIENKEEILFHGNSKKVTLPTGDWVIIREQNGADDDVLSNPVTNMDGTNFAEFFSGLILSSSFSNKPKLSVEQIMSWPINNKYALLYASRIHSIDDIIIFSYNWNDGKEPIEYAQDINELLFDYSEEPTEEMLLAKPDAIPYYPYKAQSEFLFLTSSGKRVKYNLVTMNGEIELLKLSPEERTKNAELKVRKLMLQVGDKWEIVNNFSLFTSKDMREIRKDVATNDPSYVGTVKLTNPRTGNVIPFYIVGLGEFFYPDGI